MSFLAIVASTFWSILGLFPFALSRSSGLVAEDLKKRSGQSRSYEEWLQYQRVLDEMLHANEWRETDDSTEYDWRALSRHKREIERCQMNGDILDLCGLLRAHPVRNLCRILSPKLYVQAHAGTKLLIEEYISQVRRAISELSALSSSQAPGNGFNSQTKMELFHDTRQALGRTTLVLQGGSAFSMCHLGMVKALHLRGLLPKIITGTATGTLVAALVGVSLDAELVDVLKGDAINLSAFDRNRVQQQTRTADVTIFRRSISTIWRRLKRLVKTGHFFDIAILEECARDNLGDITFEEAFARTGRILNITVSLPDEAGIPQLLNYVTAPHVLIWSAVVVSTATSKTLYAPVHLYCKDDTGTIGPFFAYDSPVDMVSKKSRGHARPQEAPLKRIGELFNVNHFIVSQTRPYVVPFIRVQRYKPSRFHFTGTSIRWAFSEIFHLLTQLSRVGYLPTPLRRLLMDETIPSGSRWAKISLTPQLHIGDLLRMFDTPTQASLDEWILRGERSVWPAVCELNVRCGIEFELDKAYEQVKRRVPGQMFNV